MEVNLERVTPGQGLRLKTCLGETLEGMVLAYDEATQCILLQESVGTAGATPVRGVVFVRKAVVTECTVTGTSPAVGVPGALTPPRFDLGALQAKEEAAVKKAEEEVQLRKAGVTDAALDLFAALSKTLPVAWEKTSILVLGEIRIASPYLPQSVTGGSTAARDRVKMVLSRERERLNLKPS